MSEKGSQKYHIVLTLAALLVGAVFLAVGILMFTHSDHYRRTTATVTEVNGGKAAVTYTVRGREYTAAWDEGNCRVGDRVKVFYDVKDPAILSAQGSKYTDVLVMAVGALVAALSLLSLLRGYNPNWEIGDFPPIVIPPREELEEYAVTFTGSRADPAYAVTDRNGAAVCRWEKGKRIPFRGAAYTFTNHRTGRTAERVAGANHMTHGSRMIPVRRIWFKLDGRDIWDLLRERGIRISTEVEMQWPPKLTYSVAHNGDFFAVIESEPVRDGDGKAKIAAGGSHYRCWSGTDDPELLCFVLFAITKMGKALAE